MSKIEVKVDKGRIKFNKENEEYATEWATIKGEAKWAEVLEPSYLYDANGLYSVKLYGDDVVKFANEVLEPLRNKAYDAIIGLGVKYSKTTMADILKIDDDGKEFLHFKLKAKKFGGEDTKPKIYDIKANNVTETWDKLIGNGSEIKVRAYCAPYYMAKGKTVGISCKFEAVQIIKLVEYIPNKTKTGDFDDETGEVKEDSGFTSDDF